MHVKSFFRKIQIFFGGVSNLMEFFLISGVDEDIAGKL